MDALLAAEQNIRDALALLDKMKLTGTASVGYTNSLRRKMGAKVDVQKMGGLILANKREELQKQVQSVEYNCN